MPIIKKTVLLVLSFFMLTACSLEGLLHKLEEHQSIIIQPSPLQYHNDSIEFEASIKLPHQVNLKAGTEYTLEFSYQTKGDSLYLGRVIVEDALMGKSRQIRQKFKMPFKAHYKSGEVMVKSLLLKNKQQVEGHSIKVADGIITTHEFIRPAYSLHLIPHGYAQKEEYEEKSFQLYFDNGKASLQAYNLNGKDAQLLEDYIAKNELNGEIQIVGNHTPEPKEAASSFIAKQRADAAANYILSLYQKYEHSTVPQMTTRGIIHDWGLFSRLVNKNQYLTQKGKDEILSQIDGGVSYHSMDARFRKLKTYPTLKEYIFPQLRQATIMVSVQKTQLTEPEIIVWAKKIIDNGAPTTTLTIEELAFAADKSSSLLEKSQIYEAAISSYPNLMLYNNLGHTYIKLAEQTTDQLEYEKLLQKAMIVLRKALKLEKGHVDATINLAAAQLLVEDDQKALQTIITLSDKLNEQQLININTIKGSLYLKRGDYIAAIKTLSSAGDSEKVTYNKGMAYLLYASQKNSNKVYQKAAQIFDQVIKANPKHAEAYYVAAITAARMKNEDQMVKYLKKAIRIDASLREKANNDLEFIQYRSKANFKQALTQ